MLDSDETQPITPRGAIAKRLASVASKHGAIAIILTFYPTDPMGNESRWRCEMHFGPPHPYSSCSCASPEEAIRQVEWAVEDRVKSGKPLSWRHIDYRKHIATNGD